MDYFPKRINRLVFVMEMQCVPSELGTEVLYSTSINFKFRSVNVVCHSFQTRLSCLYSTMLSGGMNICPTSFPLAFISTSNCFLAA
jgi:hypothetical protein